ncbi:hypothetical protein [Hydrogenimonas sp.]
MKKLLILSFLSITLFGAEGDLKRLYSMYSQKEYAKACQLGLRLFNRHKKNSKFLMLYALSCLNADYIDRLAVPMTGLRKTKTERANASYFATVILQKKLLYHALLDDVDISHLRLPKTGYILSRVFDMYTKQRYVYENGVYRFEPENGVVYLLYVDRSKRPPQMVIEERKEGKTIKRHRYW